VSEFIDTIRPLISIAMFALFTAIVLWAYAPGRRSRLDEHGRIPLRDEGEEHSL
jgi:cbb3-type cytochrome oxidase subunit 3